MNKRNEWFERCGFASLDDLQSQHWQETYNELDQFESKFLQHERDIFSAEFIWNHSSLHWWSRVWEYPYIYSHLLKLQAGRNDGSQITALDFGSGVTFFPFALAAKNFKVITVDNDPVIARDLGKAIESIQPQPGKIEILLTKTDNQLPLASESVDLIFSISVLEHIPEVEKAIQELTRILKPGGLLLLTFDVCSRGKWEITPEPYYRLTGYLRDNFDLLYPEVTIHPSRVINCNNVKYPMFSHHNLSIKHWWKRLGNPLNWLRWLKSALLKKFGNRLSVLVISVQGMVLQKRS